MWRRACGLRTAVAHRVVAATAVVLRLLFLLVPSPPAGVPIIATRLPARLRPDFAPFPAEQFAVPTTLRAPCNDAQCLDDAQHSAPLTPSARL